MSGDRHEIESEIVLPAGMELVVPPPAGDEPQPTEDSRPHGPGRRAGDSTERKSFAPFVRRAERRRAPVTQP